MTNGTSLLLEGTATSIFRLSCLAFAVRRLNRADQTKHGKS